MKPTLLALAALTLLAPLARAAETQPHSVIHVITVSWKAGTTQAQIDAALAGVKELPAKYPGIVHVWTKPIKVQGDRKFALVMEFADGAALKAYADSDAQKEWYKTYLPIRDKSTTFDITN